jgi:hypothetical protein
MTVISASHSEVESFQLCERRHYYGYGERLESTGKSDAQARGILGHAALASLYSSLKIDPSWDKAWALGVKTIRDLAPNYDQEIVSSVNGLFKAYVDYYREQWNDWTVLEVEKRYDVHISEDFVVPMVIDLIVDTPDGITVVDHKFVYDFMSASDSDMSPQVFKYARALEAEGIKVERAVYNQIRYRDTKSNKTAPGERFARQIVPLDRTAANTYMREHIMAARRIAKFRAMSVEDWERSVVRVGSKTVCDRCPFKDLCAADLHKREGEREILLSVDYRTRVKREVTSG